MIRIKVFAFAHQISVKLVIPPITGTFVLANVSLVANLSILITAQALVFAVHLVLYSITLRSSVYALQRPLISPAINNVLRVCLQQNGMR